MTQQPCLNYASTAHRQPYFSRRIFCQKQTLHQKIEFQKIISGFLKQFLNMACLHIGNLGLRESSKVSNGNSQRSRYTTREFHPIIT